MSISQEIEQDLLFAEAFSEDSEDFGEEESCDFADFDQTKRDEQLNSKETTQMPKAVHQKNQNEESNGKKTEEVRKNSPIDSFPPNE